MVYEHFVNTGGVSLQLSGKFPIKETRLSCNEQTSLVAVFSCWMVAPEGHSGIIRWLKI